jgi:peptidoglycan/LPS O-acetylase OafA/YrhL
MASPVKSPGGAAALFMPLGTAPAGRGDHYHLLDLLRGAAAISVLFWHYQHFFFPVGGSSAVLGFKGTEPLRALFWPLYDYGLYAVQLFWVISGLVFSHVYAARQRSTREFVLNRFARLYPLHLLTLLVVAALQALALARLGGWMIYQDNTAGNFLLQLGFVSSWGMARTYAFNAPIWSVSIELLVYGLFWLALPILFRRGLAMPLLLSLVFGLYFLLFPWPLLSCAQNFFAGAAVFVLVRRLGRPRLATVGAALIVVGVFGWLAVPFRETIGAPALCAAVVLFVAMAEGLGPSAPLARLRWLGDASYGIYLWHVPIQLLLFLIIPDLAMTHAPAAHPLFLLSFIAIVLLTAHLSFRTFETPARRWLCRTLKAPQATPSAETIGRHGRHRASRS